MSALRKKIRIEWGVVGKSRVVGSKKKYGKQRAVRRFEKKIEKIETKILEAGGLSCLVLGWSESIATDGATER